VKNYEQIRFSILENPKNYAPLYLKCYHCQLKGHIAIHCDFFSHIKGNLISPIDIRLSQDEMHREEIKRLKKIREELN
jgi:hypothetical protein